MDELSHGVALLHDDLLGPVNESGVGVLHANRHDWCEDVQSLPDNGASLEGMGLEQAVEHLGGNSTADLYPHTCIMQGSGKLWGAQCCGTVINSQCLYMCACADP